MSHIKPTTLLRLEKGKLYSDQRDRAAIEPTERQSIRPRCPRHFTREERKAWKAYALVLDNYGLLTSGNADTLERLATARAIYARHRQEYFALQAKLDETPGFREEENPHLEKLLEIGKTIDRLVEKLGLSSLGLAKLGSIAWKVRKERDDYFAD